VPVVIDHVPIKTCTLVILCFICSLNKFRFKDYTMSVTVLSCRENNNRMLCVRCLVPCFAGTFGAKRGSAPCAACAKDFYQDLIAMKTCNACPGTQITLADGAETINKCVNDVPIFGIHQKCFNFKIAS